MYANGWIVGSRNKELSNGEAKTEGSKWRIGAGRVFMYANGWIVGKKNQGLSNGKAKK